MSAMSDYLENKALDHLFNVASYSAPCTYAALFSTAPSDSSSGLEITAGASYLRQRVGNWDAAASGATENSSAITFPQATGSYNVVSVALMDGSTVGCATNMLWYGPLSTSRLVNTNDTFEIAASALDVTLD